MYTYAHTRGGELGERGLLTLKSGGVVPLYSCQVHQPLYLLNLFCLDCAKGILSIMRARDQDTLIE